MNRRRYLTAVAAGAVAATAGCLGGVEGEDGVYAFDADPAAVPPDALAEAGYEGEDPEPFEIETEFGEFGIDAEVSVTTWTATYANPDRGASLVVASTPDATVLGQSVNPLARADEGEVVRRLFERVREEGEAEGVDIDEESFEDRGSESRVILGTDVEVHTFATTMDIDAEDLLEDVDPDDLPDDVDPDDIDPDDVDLDDIDPDDLPDDVDPDDLDDEDIDVGDIVGDDADADDVPDDEDVTAGEGIPVLIHVATVTHDGDVVALVGIHPESIDEDEPLLSLMETVEHR